MWSENPLGRAGNQGLTCTVAQTSDHPERVCGSPTVTQLPTGQTEVIGRSVTLSSPGCSGPQDVWLSAPLRNGAAVKVYNPKTSTKNFILLLTHTRILMCNRSTLSQGMLDLSPHPQLGIQRWQGSDGPLGGRIGPCGQSPRGQRPEAFVSYRRFHSPASEPCRSLARPGLDPSFIA